ncbi:hypothetical protein [Plastoroseomonas hellenica]|uniref:hypothetical protein n=1 Tax=Plastoroseomonas hellenica TaxID=2687306 RepID=UPI001BABBC5A|nr:hypothetical protein [Plastoroseomonas hellenica]MBR0646451.1 hypothetical protein [Plastoroseomonas hellenica]
MNDCGTNLNKAVAHFAADKQAFTAVVVFRGDATGDLPHVLPVIGLRKTIGVLVVDGIKQVSKEIKDTALGEARQKVLAGMGPQPDNQQVKNAQAAARKQALETMTTNGKKNIVEVMELQYGVASNRIAYVRDVDKPVITLASDAAKQLQANQVSVIELSEATRVLRTDYFCAPELREQVRNFLTCRSGFPELSTLSSMDPVYEGILDRAVKQGDALKNDVVVIWGRMAAKRERGGAHYDLNHSNTGWAQIGNECLQRGLTVMMAGDLDPQKWAVQTGFGGKPVPNYVFLGKFFEDKERGISLTRPEQLRFWEYVRDVLSRNGKRLVHVGMRSGGMDFLGFAGQPIIYVISRDADDRRMKPVAEQLAGAQDLSYSRFEASRRPKLWKEPGTYDVQPDLARKANPETERGFTEEDLDGLMKDITRKLSG